MAAPRQDVPVPDKQHGAPHRARARRLLLHVPGPTLRGDRRTMTRTHPRNAAPQDAKSRRRRPGAARRDAGAAGQGKGRRPGGDPRQRQAAPHCRSVRHHARKPGPRPARPEAERHPVAGRRVASAHASARPTGRTAGHRAGSAWRDRVRAAPGPAAVGGRAPRPRQAAQRRGASRSPCMADRHANHHRGRRGAGLPRLHPRARNSRGGPTPSSPTGCGSRSIRSAN